MVNVQGVGPKLALRIVNELKDKVDFLAIEDTGLSEDMLVFSDRKPASSISSDAVSALVNLGFSSSDSLAAVARVISTRESNVSVEDIVRLGLRELASAKSR